jgi:protein involved in polysaccharide export with SLBB domain
MQATCAKAFARLVATWPLILLSFTGCAITPGRSVTPFPEGHRLIDSAKEIRSAYFDPLPLPRELDKHVLPAYVVEPGDQLLLITAEPETPTRGPNDTDTTAPTRDSTVAVRIPADQPILPDGSINLGIYGRIVVAGRTAEEIESMVRAAVEARTRPAPYINVRIAQRVSKVYYVLGEVVSPGTFPLQGRETVLDALLTAGGLTDRASRRNIILSRPTAPDGCRVVLPVCYREIVQLGDTSTNYQIAPGDRIFVATRGLCEDVFPSKSECPPCGRPQSSCPVPLGGAIENHGSSASTALGKPFAPFAGTTDVPPSLPIILQSPRPVPVQPTEPPAEAVPSPEIETAPPPAQEPESAQPGPPIPPAFPLP